MRFVRAVLFLLMIFVKDLVMLMLDNVKVEKFITAAMKYKGDKYSRPKRMKKGYSDCSSLVYKALADSGYLTNPGVTVTTKRMRDGDARFERIDMKDLRRGDILWGQDQLS